MKKRKLIEEGIIDDGKKFVERCSQFSIWTIIIGLNSTKSIMPMGDIMSSEEICAMSSIDFGGIQTYDNGKF